MRKEITELIDNIKQHSDELTDKPHIPQLELELIVSKIDLLYKKSILFTHEYSRSRQAPAETIKPDTEKGPEKQGPVQHPIPVRTYPDLKSLIGINQRFQFTAELFGGSAEALNEAISQINASKNKEEALQAAAELKARFGWKDDSQAADDLIRLIVKKFE